ncbi:hypothetical protein AAY72_03210 [Alishewanella sp. WH16-1]|uniref:hypothetical protein n=1 Tax=Alishewanella sp. WH16-1 TaxID=1651088 RepID=UPI000709353C|nr:hypothetical protein [Alishewanella sp. WH16-1]KRS22458.1 hypothetical protein AAY72_03210 [Alishewanella sp. WH16-1]
MGIKLYHQCGHNAKWNRDSFEKDKVGEGLILSPVHQDRNNIVDLPVALKNKSIFDPQFYLPNSLKPKFKTYDFFPNTIIGEQGFSTIDFSSVAIESANRCVGFQLEQRFEKVIIPARFFEQLNSRYTEQQADLFVVPFLKALRSKGVIGSKDIYLTVPLTSSMVSSKEYIENILNWITSYPEIDGIYFICQHDRKSKQIKEAGFLIEFMKVIKSTYDADLKVLVGYTNTEGMMYTVCGEIDLTIGAFENTRIFSLDKFLVSDEEKRGPKARIYLPKLLNWIRFEEAKLIRDAVPEIWQKIYTPTNYSEEAFELTKEPTFQTPALYKHYFKAYAEQIKVLSQVGKNTRFDILDLWISEAKHNHSLLSQIPFNLDNHGNGEHLDHWSNALNLFKKANP